MKNKSLYLVVIVLSLLLAAQYYWLQNIPPADESVLRLAANHYRMVNLFERNSFYHTLEEIERVASGSAQPKTKSAYEAVQLTQRSLREVLALLHQSYRYGDNATVDSAIKKAAEIHERSEALVKPHTDREYKLVPPDQHALDEDHAALDLTRRESQFLQNYVLFIDLYYDACCDGIYDQFYGPSLLMSNAGYKYLADTVDVMMPSAIRTGAKEVVEVTLNKKYFNKTVDSLKRTGVLPGDSRPFYKGVVKLESNGLAIEKLQSDRQVISELQHTTWRFNISASEAGTKHINGSIGVIVLDSIGQEKIIYVPLKLRAVEAL